MGRMIGCAKEKDELYYLKESCAQSGIKNQLPLLFLSESSISNKDKVLLYYFRLGHPSINIHNGKVGSLPSCYLSLPLGATFKSLCVWDVVDERF